MNKRISLILLLVAITLFPLYCLAQTTNSETPNAVIGEWRGVIMGGGETHAFDLTIKPASSGLSGEFSVIDGKASISSLSIGKDDFISFEVPGVMKLTGKVTITTGTLLNGFGDLMSGEVTMGPQKGSWRAHKIKGGGVQLATAKEYTTRGEGHYEKKAYSEAIGDFTQAIKLAPQTPVLYLSRGMIYQFEAQRQKGSTNNMSAMFEGLTGKKDAVKVIPAEAILSLNLAIDDFNRAIKLNPNFTGAFNTRGLARLEKCNLTEKDTSDCRRAVEDFSQAIKLSPNTGVLYANRASAYKKLGMEVEAETDERRSAELKGNR